MQYSIKQLKEMIAEEKMASKDYREHGMKSIANDESKHAFFLEMQLKRRQGR